MDLSNFIPSLLADLPLLPQIISSQQSLLDKTRLNHSIEGMVRNMSAEELLLVSNAVSIVVENQSGVTNIIANYCGSYESRLIERYLEKIYVIDQCWKNNTIQSRRKSDVLYYIEKNLIGMSSKELTLLFFTIRCIKDVKKRLTDTVPEYPVSNRPPAKQTKATDRITMRTSLMSGNAVKTVMNDFDAKMNDITKRINESTSRPIANPTPPNLRGQSSSRVSMEERNNYSEAAKMDIRSRDMNQKEISGYGQTSLTEQIEKINLESMMLNQPLIAKDKECEQRMKELRIIEKKRKDEWSTKLDENQREAEYEFKIASDIQKREHETRMANLRRAREEEEQEARQKQEERANEWRNIQMFIINCISSKLRFEEKEKEFSNWLKTLEGSVSNSKARFYRFENLITNSDFDATESSCKEILMDELFRLHKITLSSYDMMYKSCLITRSLYEQNSDKNFLIFLEKNLIAVTNNIHDALKEIDGYMENISSIESIKQQFHKIRSSDILTTDQLREMANYEVPSDNEVHEELKNYYTTASMQISEINYL